MRTHGGRALALFLVAALAGCTSGGDAPTETSVKPSANAPVDQPPEPAPAALGSLAYGVDGDIYVADGDGSNPARIADGRPPSECGDREEFWGEGQIWSPDGRYLAYRRTDCAAPDSPWWKVVVSDTQGNTVAEFPGDGWDISWSPDSTRVAVWVDLFETIGIYGVDGERRALLTVPPGWQPSGDYDPVWLPDGESLMVNSLRVPIGESVEPSSAVRRPEWAYSSDESRVAYSTKKSLVVAEADGSNPQEVFDDFAYDALWSPNGDQIAFISFVATPHMSDGHLRLLDLATGKSTLLAEADRSYQFEIIDFSPEGDRILYSTSALRNGVSSLWSINVDGSDRRRLVAGTVWGDWWSPSQTR